MLRSIRTAAVCAALTACSAPSDPPDARRAVHGVVVTDLGDPAPGATLLVAGRTVAETDLSGSFCFFADPDALKAAVRRAGFPEAALEVAGGGADFEALVRLAPPAPGERFFVVDPYLRGVAGAEVALFPPGGAAPFFRGSSGADGRVSCGDASVAGSTCDLRAVSPTGTACLRAGVRLERDGVVPIDDAPREREPLCVEFPPGGAPAEHWDVGFLDDAGLAFARSSVRGGAVESQAPRGADVWISADDGALALLRRVGPARGRSALSVAPRRTLDFAADADALASSPVLAPLFGAPRVTRGESMTDVAGGDACRTPTIPLRRVADRLLSPALALDARFVCLRTTRPDQDLRLLCDLAPWDDMPEAVRADVRSFRGGGVVSVRLDAAPADAGPFYVTVSRRGGSYSETKLVEPGTDATWRGLAAGAFLVAVERRPPSPKACRGTPEVQVFASVQRAVVGPGERVEVRARVAANGPTLEFSATRAAPAPKRGGR